MFIEGSSEAKFLFYGFDDEICAINVSELAIEKNIQRNKRTTY